jgi:hypothetical protein
VHPLGRMVGHLVDVYRATYVGVGAHPRLLPHAVAEVHSFVSRIYAFIRLLFPALPSEDRPCYLDEGIRETISQCCSALLEDRTDLIEFPICRWYCK